MGESLGIQGRPQRHNSGTEESKGNHLWPSSHSTSRIPSAGASLSLLPAALRSLWDRACEPSAVTDQVSLGQWQRRVQTLEQMERLCRQVCGSLQGLWKPPQRDSQKNHFSSSMHSPEELNSGAWDASHPDVMAQAVPTLRQLMQEDHEVEASLDNTAKPGLKKAKV